MSPADVRGEHSSWGNSKGPETGARLRCKVAIVANGALTPCITGCLNEEKLKLAFVISVNSRKVRLLHYK